MNGILRDAWEEKEISDGSKAHEVQSWAGWWRVELWTKVLTAVRGAGSWGRQRAVPSQGFSSKPRFF